MLDSFIFVSKTRLESIEGCGMKLSSWADRHVFINGEQRSFISSLFNPRDNMEKYKSADYSLVKIEIDIDYCYVAEGFLLNKSFPSLNYGNSLYANTIIPAKDYIFGMYRQPECLIGKTILPNEMKIPSKALSFPLFYESSTRMYLNKLIEELREENDQFDDFILRYYYDCLTRKGEVDRITDDKNSVAVFIQKDGKRQIVITLLEQEELIEG